MNYQKKVPIYRDAVCLVVEIDSAVRGFLYTLNGGMRIIAYGLLTAINNKNNRKQLIKKAHQLGNFVNSALALLRQGFNKLLIWQKLNFGKNSYLYKGFHYLKKDSLYRFLQHFQQLIKNSQNDLCNCICILLTSKIIRVIDLKNPKLRLLFHPQLRT
ncbi:hypothetical protein [uncultured Gammaproteobacteria bacterium]|jgi:hypothetical protein|nr:hypothetical protein [uncultured Gammaproteobacteria bacterium]CAC9566514.1 hypothetical protein [uncultured Gammaproteobacteria bacterium]CAC9570132.1 hypothetical protein [uncultured Gammaproteobacteria bacterium]CAC9585203.1 hypothetical protein [uncultured Gammaproteobacteria bacterium]